MLVLLLAAIGKKNKGGCNGYVIALKENKEQCFIDTSDVATLLQKSSGGSIKGKPVASFDLHELEKQLEKEPWISEAEMYFDNNNVLHVTVTEKEPVARLFTPSGQSFYIDALGNKIPLSDRMTGRVPFFTGFTDVKDSILLNGVTKLANFIVRDSFWLSQVAQVDIVGKQNFEMIPVVGNHLVKLGAADNLDEKFNRLYIFYKQVLSKVGFDKYRLIDVRFKGQVVASRQSGNVKVNPKEYAKTIERLIKESNEIPETAVRKPVTVTGKYELQKDSVTAPVPELEEIEIKRKPEKKEAANPNPVKPFSPEKEKEDKQPEKKVKEEKKEEKRVPKAVMPPRTPESTPDEEENGGYN